MNRIIAFIFLTMFAQVSLAACDQTLSTGANIASAVSSAASGATICLGSGSYGSVSLGSTTKSSMTTVTPADGATVTIGNINIGSAQNIAFVGPNMSIDGFYTSTSTAAQHILFNYITVTNDVCIYTPGDVGMDFIIEYSTFYNIGEGCTEGRLGVHGLSQSHAVDSGVIIRYNNFGSPTASNSGASDGIQLTGNATGVTILRNEFRNIKESRCGTVHCDPIQIYGAQRIFVTENYFHDNSTGLMFNGGNQSPVFVTGNVFVTDGEYPDQIVLAGDSDSTFTHNTFANGASFRCGDSAGGCTNEVFRDNILTGGFNFVSPGSQGAFGAIDHNLISGAAIGTGGINGSPTYINSPQNSWDDYQITTGSLGHNTASDGLDMGALYYGSTVATPTISALVCSLTNIQAPAGSTECTVTASNTPTSYSYSFASCSAAACSTSDTDSVATVLCSNGGACTVCATATNAGGTSGQYCTSAGYLKAKYRKPTGLQAN